MSGCDEPVLKVDTPASIEELTDFDLCLGVAPVSWARRYVDDLIVNSHGVVVTDGGWVIEAANFIEVCGLADRPPGRRHLGGWNGESSIVVWSKSFEDDIGFIFVCGTGKSQF